LTATIAPSPDRPPRTLSREARRAQLIEATIETLAQRGFSRTTLTEVARMAGLSHGLVLFHFETKEKLLAETLAFLAEEYRANWLAALDAAGPLPAAQLNALIEADFNLTVFTPARLSAWCAFWGEAQSRPSYQRICGERDAAYIRQMEETCAALAEEGGYALNPAHAARILRLVIEGIWLDMVTVETPYSLDEARKTVAAALSLCFPRHFAADRIALMPAP
jgi:TetR/AcrR family transcriptional repressor of bet genes